MNARRILEESYLAESNPSPIPLSNSFVSLTLISINDKHSLSCLCNLSCSLLHPHPRWCVYHSPLDRAQINRWSVQHTKILTALPMPWRPWLLKSIFKQKSTTYIWYESTSKSRIYRHTCGLWMVLDWLVESTSKPGSYKRTLLVLM